MKKTLLLSLAALLLGSCKTAMLYTTLDILRPAQVGFDDGVNHLLIVNNSAIQPEVLGHTTRLLNGQPKQVAVPADSIALFGLSVLAEEMEATGFFRSIDLQLEPLSPGRSFDNIVPLQQDQVRQLCEAYDADAVLALDHMAVKDDLGEYYDYEWGTYLAALDVRIESLWSLHYPDRMEVAALHFKDSLFWESDGYIRQEAIDRLPQRQDAIIDAALWVGQNSAKRFIPHWEQADRYFFDPDNALMKQGMDSVYVRNWPAAARLWQQAYDTAGKPKLKAQAANNLAIAHEIMGDYDTAYVYADRAFNLFAERAFIDSETLFRLANYMNALNRRKKEVKLLDEQMGE